MKFASPLSLYAALATAAVVSAAGLTSGPKGVNGVIFLDGPCTQTSDCAGGETARCSNQSEYLKVLPDGARKGDKASFACAYAKVLTGVCGYAGKKQCACYPPNDSACTYINDCNDFDPIPKCGIPNAIVDEEGKAMCRCPRTCEGARAGFSRAPPPQDECSDPYKLPGGSGPP